MLVQVVKLFTKNFEHLARMQSMPSLEKKYGMIQRILYADIVLAETQDAIDSFKLKENRVMANPLDKQGIDNLLSKKEEFYFDLTAVASGRLCYDKGFDVLIKQVVSIYPNFKLYILGRDDGTGNELIIDNKLQNNIFLEGFQPNPYKYYNSSKMFILSSRREGFPNVLIENYYLNSFY